MTDNAYTHQGSAMHMQLLGTTYREISKSKLDHLSVHLLRWFVPYFVSYTGCTYLIIFFQRVELWKWGAQATEDMLSPSPWRFEIKIELVVSKLSLVIYNI